MSIFSYPRIHVKGLLVVNVGTGNNDDYSSLAVMGAGYPGFEDWPLRQADSPNVQPMTYGMTDDQWTAWAQQRQRFALSPVQQPQTGSNAPVMEMNKAEGNTLPSGEGADVWYVPGEWNYFGDMGLFMLDMNVVGVVNGNGTNLDPSLVTGAQISFDNRPDSTGRSTGMLVDVNAEDVPCSIIIADSLMLARDGTSLLAGPPSKAVTRFINFQRNTQLNGPNGAGCMFQCTVPLAQLSGSLVGQLPPTQGGQPLSGVVFRYYLFRPLQEINTFQYPSNTSDPNSPWFAQIEARYQQGHHLTQGVPTSSMTPQEVEAVYAQNGQNPDYIQVVGTVAPAYGDEVASCPTGRVLLPSGSIPVPNGNGNGPVFQLAPAIVSVNTEAQVVSVDFSGTFPDALQVTGGIYDPLVTNNNPKWDFGPVSLQVTDGTNTLTLSLIEYTDTAAGDAIGWIFDIPFSYIGPDAMKMVQDGTSTLILTGMVNNQPVQLLVEQEYLVVSDQACIWGEQVPDGPSLRQFVTNDGVPGPSTIRVFKRGVELTAAECPPVTLWEYDTTPNQAPGNGQILTNGWGPGQPLTVDPQSRGNRLYTFVVDGQAPPPGYSGIRTFTSEPDPSSGPLYPPLMYGQLPLVMAPMINLRLLPNDRDYSWYYVPGSNPPVGNDLLTWDVVYNEVLRNYYLLYPGMSQRVPLNDPTQWEDPQMAIRLLQRTQPAVWGTSEYMPRTRDMSDSRRTLLQAWAYKCMQGGTTPPSSAAAPAAPAGAPDPAVPA
jgi:hypothetical protein